MDILVRILASSAISLPFSTLSSVFWLLCRLASTIRSCRAELNHRRPEEAEGRLAGNVSGFNSAVRLQLLKATEG